MPPKSGRSRRASRASSGLCWCRRRPRRLRSASRKRWRLSRRRCPGRSTMPTTSWTRREPLAFAQLPFDHPVYVLYSSGTTGVPKAIVHGAGGTLLQHLKELLLHTDLGRDDRLFYLTTCGWMMWNWQVSGLATGATLVMYDGSPFYPDGNRLFDLAEQERVTVFGTSAKYLDTVKKAGLAPGREPRPRGAARDPLDRLAAGRRELRLRLRVDQGRRASGLDLGRHRHRLLLRARRSDRAGVARRDPGRRARHGGRGLGRARPPGRGTPGRAGLHETLPVDADRLLERPGRRALPQRLFRALPRASGAMAT